MTARLLLLSLVMIATACGSSGSDARDGDAGGNAADGGPPATDAADAGNASGCAQVCWRVVPRLRNPEEGETESFTSEECRCPDGYACTGTQTISTGVATRNGLRGYHDPPTTGEESIPTGRGTATYKVCEPIDRQRPPALVLDFRDDAPLVPVTLRFQRAGGPWPQSPTPGSAGEITITPERPRAQLVEPIPTGADGTLKVMLPRGRHGVRLQMGRGTLFDPMKYPISTLEGELTVERAGEAIIDVPATPFTFDVRVGGAPFPVPRASESVALRIEGRYGVPGVSSNLLVWKRAAGQALEKGTVWLEPGKYTVNVITEGALENPSVPGGYVIVTRFLEIGAAPVERTFDLRIVKLEGDLTINGMDLPAAAKAEVNLASKDAVGRALLGPARPAHYQVLAFAAEYDVELATEAGAESAGVPAGGVRAFTRKLLDQNLVAPIQVTSLPFLAEVTANGAPLADEVHKRGALVLEGGISHDFSLGTMGPAMVSGLVYAGGPSAVKVLGAAGGKLPPFAMTVTSDFTPSSAPAKFDLTLAPLTIGLRIDGRDPPASPLFRGSFRLTRADDPTSTLRAPASLEGRLTTSVAVPPGTWKAVFQSGGATVLPAGEIALPDLVVPREGLAREFELVTAELVVEVSKNGAPLAEATATKDRGAVQVGATRVRLPRTGPARLAVKVFPGVTSVSVACDETCGAGLPPFLTVVPRVRAGSAAP